MTDRERRAVWLAVTVGLIATSYVLLIAAAGPRSLSTNGTLLDLTLGYTPQFVAGLFAEYGAEGRQKYAEFLLTDALYIPIYTTCAVVVLAITWARPWPSARWAMGLAVATGVVDWIEDGLNWSSVSAYPALDPGVIQLASTSTITKWVLVIATVAVILVGLVSRRRELLLPVAGRVDLVRAFVLASLLVVLGLALVGAWSQRSQTSTAPPAEAPSEVADVYAKALALARAGFAEEALTEAKRVVALHPELPLPSELSRLVDPHRDDPFGAARALATSGFDAKAQEEVAKQLAARPGRTIPPDLRYLTDRPGEVFVDGRLDPIGAWSTIPNLRSSLGIVLRDIGLLTAAALIVLLAVVPLIRRAIQHRYRVEAFQEEVASPALGKTIAVLVEDELQRLQEEGGGSRLEFVRGTDAVISLPDALKDLPKQVGWLAALLSLVPANTSTVVGTLHGRGARGVGITVALTSPRGEVARSVTIWEDEFDPTYSPPAKDLEPGVSVAAYQALAMAAAIWLQYRLQ